MNNTEKGIAVVHNVYITLKIIVPYIKYWTFQ